MPRPAIIREERMNRDDGNLRTWLQDPPAREGLAEAYRRVRQFTHTLCEPLETEDYVVQTMPDVSPTRWHLAHTSWFFEAFILREAIPDYREFHPQYSYLFNSYYNTIGSQFLRPHRGLLTRPTVAEINRYREAVDRAMEDLLAGADDATLERFLPLVQVGLHHEQQHQELMLTDIKNVLAFNPLRPAYRERDGDPPAAAPPALDWIAVEGGINHVGRDRDGGFFFDNEAPRHEVFLEPFGIASRPVSNGEFTAFIEDGGYDRHELWLSDGWAAVKREGWRAPLYWEQSDGEWRHMTLAGMRRVDPAEPVCHLSYYEAEAFAAWSGARLPTEAEWEVAARDETIAGNFVESGRYHPAPAADGDGGHELLQIFGDVWEWTRSPYTPYPGFRPEPGALGEYNGKFMCSQQILRGGSAATSATHIRPTYRNFFYPHQRWQFTGLRLASDSDRS
jgi:ergothioneine biosynthesis protein EgtB